MALAFLFSGSLHVGRWTAPSGLIGNRSPWVCCPWSPFFSHRLWSMASPTSPVPSPSTLSFASWPSVPGLGLSRCILCSQGAQGSPGPLSHVLGSLGAGTLEWQVLLGDSSACWGLGRGCCARDDTLLSEMRGSFCWKMGDWRGGQFAVTTAVPCCLSACQFLGDPTFILATVTGAVRHGLWARVYTHTQI